MRFEVSYPAGSPHEVDLPGTVAVLGRDPASDLVLNDTKCSRRHAGGGGGHAGRAGRGGAPRPEAPPPSRAPEDRPARTAPAPALRRFRACPPTITLLALLWLLSAVGFAGLGLFAAARIASGSGWGWGAGGRGLLGAGLAARGAV